MSRARTRISHGPGFTLIEVMIAVGVLGIAMLSLLALHNQNLHSVIRAQELSRAAMLAQGVMSQAELERFPLPGRTSGDFERTYRGMYRNYRWERDVTPSDMFPDICKVQVTIFWGAHFRSSYSVMEFLHNPVPPPMPTQAGGGPNAPQQMPAPFQQQEPVQ
jgi:type II secretion system protein I